ncbi:cobalt-precorrin-5B (C(1))-methyltransferase CbiD [Maridesulfovibrio ferrireducens]|uniref:cobalt-precorrin-5B (C(1))-methyltransferase CbiD n=1 Tax=Maridesulfovibrio ferrireducens TaxID=246191 RepID=UPI001A25862F|nr:cobalt-precorrin-5B (C(1))-methyltransferase CbiD [Maridesulfovibrio ferrireducens]MBI9112113.1 cobalt-precorrin-5B (C(1))-methyltransferase [Maridesulfovibrio ferrireducens]
MKKNLREGFTTGSAATAAAMSALRVLLGGSKPDSIETPLPEKGSLVIPVERVELSGLNARAIVIKDGGDDPDATNGHEIHAVVEHIKGNDDVRVKISGGIGVGKVTQPGLPVPVGEPAINPAPRKQIITGILKELSETAPQLRGTIKVRIEVPQGEAISLKTMNSRLGILGGISILGTQGIVRPFSHASWEASIALAVNVAKATGIEEIIFTTGRRSERFYLERFPETPQLAMIQAADFFNGSMLEAETKGICEVHWSIFIGKLVKHAMGFPYTHAKDWRIDFALLAKWCDDLNIAPAITTEIAGANTALQVFDMIPESSKKVFIDMLIVKAEKNALLFTLKKHMTIKYHLFDFDGNLLNNDDDNR